MIESGLKRFTLVVEQDICQQNESASHHASTSDS